MLKSIEYLSKENVHCGDCFVPFRTLSGKKDSTFWKDVARKVVWAFPTGDSTENLYGLCDFLLDAKVSFKAGGLDEVCTWLNENNYRRLTDKELRKILK